MITVPLGPTTPVLPRSLPVRLPQPLLRPEPPWHRPVFLQPPRHRPLTPPPVSILPPRAARSPRYGAHEPSHVLPLLVQPGDPQRMDAQCARSNSAPYTPDKADPSAWPSRVLPNSDADSYAARCSPRQCGGIATDAVPKGPDPRSGVPVAEQEPVLLLQGPPSVESVIEREQVQGQPEQVLQLAP
jgi:hypothetical protein